MSTRWRLLMSSCKAIRQGRLYHKKSQGHRFNWADGGDHATHNDLPIPHGDWSDWYGRRNMRNNLVLATGATALAVAISLVFFSGTITFNYLPPEHWQDEYEECECENHQSK